MAGDVRRRHAHGAGELTVVSAAQKSVLLLLGWARFVLLQLKLACMNVLIHGARGWFDQMLAVCYLTGELSLEFPRRCLWHIGCVAL